MLPPQVRWCSRYRSPSVQPLRRHDIAARRGKLQSPSRGIAPQPRDAAAAFSRVDFSTPVLKDIAAFPVDPVETRHYVPPQFAGGVPASRERVAQPVEQLTFNQ